MERICPAIPDATGDYNKERKKEIIQCFVEWVGKRKKIR